MSLPDPLAALESQLAAAEADLTEARKQLGAALDRETKLRAELQHRVRNMLAIIKSIFTRTITAGGPLDDISRHFEGRLDTVARYQSFHALDDSGVDFEMMLRDELHSFQFGDDPAIRLTGDEARLSQDMAQLAALAIHELVTNSIKFGVLSGANARARLEISWTASDDSLTLHWTETGISVLRSAPLRQGFGREFVEQALVYQTGGSSSFELGPGMLTCIISIPLDARASPMI
jgi:two-component sensor histidine kinase